MLIKVGELPIIGSQCASESTDVGKISVVWNPNGALSRNLSNSERWELHSTAIKLNET